MAFRFPQLLVSGTGAFDHEDGVLGRDGAELLVGRVGADAVEELADFPLPAAQVGAEHVELLVVGQLASRVNISVCRPEPQLAAAGDAEVAHPLRDASGRDEVRCAVDVEQVHRRVRHSPLLRPRTRSSREPQTLRPARVDRR